MKYFVTATATVLLLLFVGCDSQEDDPELFHGTAATFVEEPGSVMALTAHEDGLLVATLRSDNSSRAIEDIVGAVVVDDQGRTLTLTLNSQGLPTQAYANGYIFVFSNYTNNSIDIATIGPDGSIEITREIQIDLSDFNNVSKRGSAPELSTVIRWTAIGVKFVSCVIQATAAVHTGGILIPLATNTCASAILSTWAQLSPGDDPALEDGALVTGVFGSLGCATTLVECAFPLADALLGVAANAREEYERHNEEILVATGALESGSGDVQVTLTWDAAVDLDLWVTDPFGERIYFAHRTSQSGGLLDRDDLDGFGPENIFWPSGQAPTGQYTVQVDHFSGSQTANYTVLIQAFGRAKSYTGSIRPDQTIDVTTFSDSGLARVAKNEVCQTCAVLKTSINKE